MRQMSEINNDIEEVDGKIKALRARHKILIDERRERIFADFCYKYDVKFAPNYQNSLNQQSLTHNNNENNQTVT